MNFLLNMNVHREMTAHWKSAVVFVDIWAILECRVRRMLRSLRKPKRRVK